MRFAPVFRYRFRDSMTAVAAVLLVMIAVTALCYLGIMGFGMITMTDETGESVTTDTTMNFGMPIAIFMFVLGIVSIREDMRLGIQNGASRGSTFAANLACMLVTGLIVNAAFLLLTLVWNLFDTGVYIVDLFGTIYYGGVTLSLTQTLIAAATGLALSICLAGLGTFISLMYWRLNRLGKWLVSLGTVAAAILFVDVVIRYEAVARPLGRFIAWIGETPWNLVLCFVLLSAVFYGFARLLVRRNAITAATI